MSNIIEFKRNYVSPKNIVVVAVVETSSARLAAFDISSRTVRCDIWSRKFSKNVTLSERYRKQMMAVAAKLQDMIHTMTPQVVTNMMVGNAKDLVNSMIRDATLEYQLEQAKRNANVMYDRGDWRIMHPVSNVWTVMPQGDNGTSGQVTILTTKNRLRVRVVKADKSEIVYYAPPKPFDAIISAMTRLMTENRSLWNVTSLKNALNEVGITNDSASNMSDDVHRKLTDIIHDLTIAATRDGLPGIYNKLRELAEV